MGSRCVSIRSAVIAPTVGFPAAGDGQLVSAAGREGVSGSSEQPSDAPVEQIECTTTPVPRLCGVLHKEAVSPQYPLPHHYPTTTTATMRLTFPTLAIAAFALAASAAPTAETTTALPARFSLTTITAEPRANGLRVRVSANGSK